MWSILIALVVFIINITLCGFFLKINPKTNSDSAFCGGVIALAFLGIVICLITLFLDPKPKAIDVYRGNTTLQITYQDSIPIDTTVVFK